MAEFTGYNALLPRGPADIAGLSTNFGFGEAPATDFECLYVPINVRTAGDADGHWQHTVQTTHWSIQGFHGFTNNLWDKVITVPSSRDFGTVLSRQNFSIEVWSTYRYSQQTMTGITSTGSGNIVVEDAYGVPLVYQPCMSRTYDAYLPTNGDATIDNVVDFAFANIPHAYYGATGSRVTVFWPGMNWDAPFKEAFIWLTSIITSHDGSEQRIQLRTKPRFGAEFNILTMDRQQTALLEAQLFFGQCALWGVPWWPEYSTLSSPVSIGDSIINTNTTESPTLEVGGLVMLWKNGLEWEVQTITEVEDTYIRTSATFTKAWDLWSRVVPVRKGYMSAESIPIVRPTNWLSAATFSFECESL